jgi:hypothetical protein
MVGKSERDSDRPPPPDEDLHGRRYVERVLRETVRRVVETGVEKLAEGPENLRNFVADMKLPKDIANHLLLQIDETKNGLYRVVAKEVGGFLQKTNIAEEFARALRLVSVEIKTEIRFVPTAGGADAAGAPPAKPEVKTEVRVRSERPPR